MKTSKNRSYELTDGGLCETLKKEVSGNEKSCKFLNFTTGVVPITMKYHEL